MLFQIEVHRYNRGGPTLSSTVCSVQVVGRAACESRGDRSIIFNIFEAFFHLPDGRTRNCVAVAQVLHNTLVFSDGGSWEVMCRGSR